MPVEQLLSKRGFERLDRRGDGRLRHVETGGGSRNLADFGGGDEVADLTEGQSHKNFRYQRTFFRILQLLAATQKIKLLVWFGFEKASQWLPPTWSLAMSASSSRA